ncbi:MULTISPECIES: energy transducer TonB [unclassified Acidiphilium]|uniref:energy transducer TonB n=1 Tax=unclassified Acidiphilium TaxID=2617493 RepID=UPI0025C561E6|nr:MULTISPECIES: energy transducer TonB [unclassified Acidiphilium]HQT61275.1 energy transducer TonB [Acidiphilium sp.]
MRRPATTPIRITDPVRAGGVALGAAPPPMARPRRRRRWRIPLPVSIALHAAILLLLLYVVHRRRLPEPHPQSGIEVVFQNSGLTHTAKHDAAPAEPRHAPEATPSLPPPPLAAPPPQPALKPVPAPSPAPPAVHLDTRQFAPPPMQASIVPHAPPVPKSPPRPSRPAPRHSYVVMNGMSFGSRPSTALTHRSTALNLAPAAPDFNRHAPDIVFKGKAGPDWQSAFNKWVNTHDYYPEGAAAQGQQGSVTVSFTVLPDGRVIDLHMVSRSGAPLLDMAWYGLFNGAQVPKFPPGSKAKSEQVTATIHFILIH